jgi:hypothetical protein
MEQKTQFLAIGMVSKVIAFPIINDSPVPHFPPRHGRSSDEACKRFEAGRSRKSN